MGFRLHLLYVNAVVLNLFCTTPHWSKSPLFLSTFYFKQLNSTWHFSVYKLPVL